MQMLIVLPAWALYAEKPTSRAIAGLAVGFVGLLVVAVPGGGGSGAALSLGAAAAATAGTLIARRLGDLDNIVAGGWSFLLGGAALAPWSAWTRARRRSGGACALSGSWRSWASWHPATLFPRTGLPRESSGPRAPGSAVNIPVPVGTGSSGWLRALDAVVPPLLRQFRPQILVSQHGCDTQWSDPLAGLEVTIDAQRAAHAAIHALAHETAGGRWLLTGGGGYQVVQLVQVVQVVPRSWTHLLAEASGRPLDPAAITPAPWREYVAWAAAEKPPEVMTEGEPADFLPFDWGYDPLDRAILATRQAVFPQHGLMPHS